MHTNPRDFPWFLEQITQLLCTGVPETLAVYAGLNNLCEINNKGKNFKKVSNVRMLVIGMQSTETSCM